MKNGDMEICATLQNPTELKDRGLTKRELFAALAMQGYCARPQTNATQGPEAIADLSVDTADRLLTALETSNR